MWHDVWFIDQMIKIICFKYVLNETEKWKRLKKTKLNFHMSVLMESLGKGSLLIEACGVNLILRFLCFWWWCILLIGKMLNVPCLFLCFLSDVIVIIQWLNKICRTCFSLIYLFSKHACMSIPVLFCIWSCIRMGILNGLMKYAINVFVDIIGLEPFYRDVLGILLPLVHLLSFTFAFRLVL